MTVLTRALCGALSLACTVVLAQPASTDAPSAPAAALAEAAKPLPEQARELLAAGRAPQALAVARRAVDQQPSDYKGHYYLAYALMELGETAAAQRAGSQAEALAPSPEAKAAVRALQGTIVARDGLKEADTALADGLHAKAGRLYLEIWKRGGLPPDKTLAAADLLHRQLDDLPGAVAMLRDLGTRHIGTPAADEAARRLVGLQTALRREADVALSNASKLDPGNPERARWLRNALEADETNTEARVMLANDAAETNDWPALEQQFKLLQRRGQLLGLLEERKLALGRWQNHAGLQGLMADIWGGKRAGELLQANTAQAGPVAPERAERIRQQAEARLLEQFRQAGLVGGNGVAFRDCAQCPEMVWLPAGAMPARANPSPFGTWLNRVRFAAPFAVGKFEVTFAEWDACVADGGCRPDVPEGFTYGTFFDTKWGRGRQPLVNVHQRDARAYADWLSRKTGQSYRLLSFAEFIYAMRAGSTAPADTHTGNCVGCSNPTDKPLPVGSLPANPWGLHDLVGNVHEMIEGCNGDPAQSSGWPVDGRPITTGCMPTDAGSATWGMRTEHLGGAYNHPKPNGQGAIALINWYESLPAPNSGFRVVRSFAPR